MRSNMKKLFPDLWQTTLYTSGIVNSHAYLLTKESGNVLIYNTGNENDLDEIEELGGIEFQLLTHRDEARTSLSRIKERFKSKLIFSELESHSINRYEKADSYFPESDHELSDLKVLMTPGHTDGSVSFYYTSPFGKKYLFIGEALFQWNNQWTTLVLGMAGGTDIDAINSLKKIYDLEPDVVMSSGFIGDTGVVEPTALEWTLAIEKEIEKLSRNV